MTTEIVKEVAAAGSASEGEESERYDKIAQQKAIIIF